MSIRLDNVTAGRWCGGVQVTPREFEGAHALAATPAYLDSYDALLLFVMAAGGAEAARQWLDEYDPNQLDTAIARRTAERDHDRVLNYWDRQP